MPGALTFLPRWIGIFRISKKVSVVAYKLELPDTMKLHNVFHVSLLKSYRASGIVHPPPPPILFIDALFHIKRNSLHQ